MNKLLLLPTLFFTLSASTQITIDSDDMPVAGTTQELIVGNTFTFLDFQSAGPETTWDYSELQEFSATIEEYVNVSATPILYQFLFNSPFNEEYQASFALEGEDLELEGLSFTNVYDYFKVSEEQYAAVGQGITFNGIPLPSQLSPVDVIYEFPMEYGNSHNSYSELFFVFPELMTYKLKQNRETEVDGWGTLTLPSGSIECLRVRHSLNITDSLVFPQAEIDFEIPRPEEVIYQWLAIESGAPMLEVRQVFGLNTFIQYQTIEEVTEIAESPIAQLVVYPNPCADFLQTDVPTPYRYSIIDQSGRLVANDNCTTGQIATSHFQMGKYLLRIENEDGVQTIPFVVN